MTRSAALFHQVMAREAELLHATEDDFNAEVFDRAVDIIAKGRRVYVLGVRSGAPLAEYLAFYLNQMMPDVRLIRSSAAADIFEQMMHLKEKDVVIGISFPRYSMRVLKAMEFANARQASIVTLTDDPHSPICLYSSCNLTARTAMTAFADSMNAPMAVISALVTAVGTRRQKALKNNLENLEKIWEDFPLDTYDELDPLDPSVTLIRRDDV